MTVRRLSALPLAAALLSAASALHAEPVRYSIDPTHTFPVFEVIHHGYSTQRGRFNRTSGGVTLDLAARSGSANVTIATDSIDMGFARWNEAMKAEGYFNVADYPEMRFESDRLVFDGAVPVAAEGRFTLLGVTRPLTLKIERFRCAPHPLNKRETCGADLSAQLRRSEFGMTKGLPGVGDDVRLLVPVEIQREP